MVKKVLKIITNLFGISLTQRIDTKSQRQMAKNASFITVSVSNFQIFFGSYVDTLQIYVES